MTSFGAILKQAIKSKFKILNTVMLALILADVVLSILMIFTNGSHNFWSSVFGCTVGIVIIIVFLSVGYLCKLTIDETTSNKYRLIPISDTGLYLSSIISNVVNFFYVNIVSFVLLYASAFIASSKDKDFHKAMSDFPRSIMNGENIVISIWIIGLFLLMVIAFILLINMSNLLTNIAMNILPLGKQKTVKSIINLIVFLLIFKLISMVDVSDVIRTINLSDNQLSWITFAGTILEVILFSVININLLRFVETNK